MSSVYICYMLAVCRLCRCVVYVVKTWCDDKNTKKTWQTLYHKDKTHKNLYIFKSSFNIKIIYSNKKFLSRNKRNLPLTTNMINKYYVVIWAADVLPQNSLASNKRHDITSRFNHYHIFKSSPSSSSSTFV